MTTTSTGWGKRTGHQVAEFMERRGYRIIEAAGAFWQSVSGGFYMRLPDELVGDPDPAELNRMTRSARALGVCYLSRQRPGLASGRYVCRLRPYTISSVDPRQRSRVRRGLESCQVGRVEEAQLLAEGMRLNLDTMERQGRYDAEFGDPARWKRIVEAVRETPGVVPYGAFRDGRLAAYAITCRDGGWLYILQQMSRLDLLEHHPNHALTFRLTEQAMRDPELEAICYGTISLLTLDGLDEYKRRFGYQVERQSYVFHLHPAAAPVLTSRMVEHSLGFLRRLRPDDQRLERVSSVLAGARMLRRNQAADAGIPAQPDWEANSR